MKNLSQFKKRIAETIAKGGTVDFHFKREQQYLNHPAAAKYPDGLQIEEKEYKGCKLGRLQSNAFTRLDFANETRESWCYFESAARWTFPDQDTAVYTEALDYRDQWKGTLTLTYKFNPIPA